MIFSKHMIAAAALFTCGLNAGATFAAAQPLADSLAPTAPASVLQPPAPVIESAPVPAAQVAAAALFADDSLTMAPTQDPLPLASFSPAYFDVLSWPTGGDRGEGIEATRLSWRHIMHGRDTDSDDAALMLDVATLVAALAPEQKRSFAETLLDDSARIVDESLSYLGIKYRWGGNDPKTGFDCSGLVKHVFANALGLNLPRTAREMAKAGEKITRKELLPGDLVFFNTRGSRFSHVGIHIGDGKFVHAPRKGKTITIASLSNTYWKRRFNGAVRVMN